MGIIVYPRYSPRLILVQSPDTEITIQELHNQIRDWEENPAAMSFPDIAQTSGGEDLGGGTSVGLTMELQDARVGFEQRHIILESGTVTTNDTEGRTLVDTAADFIAADVQPGDMVINFTDQSWGTVLYVESATSLLCFPLGAGVDNQFAISDSYKILNIVECEVSGGNLTSVDTGGSSLRALFPTAAVNYIRTSSASATQSDLEAIQYSSFQNAIWVKPSGSVSGTSYPAGTREFPVNNIPDAVAIANTRGFSTLQILESMTIDSGTDITGFSIIGYSHVSTKIIIDTSAQCENVTIKNCNVTGVLDGGTHLRDCMVGSLDYVNGHIHSSGLYGTILLDGNEDAVIVDCYTVDQDNPCIIDMGGTGQSLAVPNYSGLITIKNLTSATEEIGVGLNAGAVVLDSTITAGTVVISGVGLLTNNSTGATIVNTDGLMSKETITEISWDEIWIDTSSSYSGVTFPVGTRSMPVNNITDARAIAEFRSIEIFHCHGSIILNNDFSGYVFDSHSPNECIIDLNNQVIDNATFRNITLSGQCNGAIYGQSCVLSDGMTGMEGILVDGFILGTLGLAGAGSRLNLKRVTAGGSSGAIIDLVGPNRILGSASIDGIWTIKNVAAGPPPTIAQLEFNTGQLTIDSTCTGGNIIVNGIVTVTDNSGTSCLVIRDGQIEAAPGAYREEVLLDITNGSSGTTYPLGTTGYPVDNLADAKTIAEANNIYNIKVFGSITLTSDFSGYTFFGHSSVSTSVNINGQAVEGSVFKDLTLTGNGIGYFEAVNCEILSGSSDIEGHLENCILGGAFTIKAAKTLKADRCTSSAGCTFDLNATGSLAFSNFSGVIASVSNATDSGCLVAVTGIYLLTLSNSLTAGQALIAGVGILTDNSNGMTITEKTLPSAVWDEAMGSHQDAGSVGANQQHGVVSL